MKRVKTRPRYPMAFALAGGLVLAGALLETGACTRLPAIHWPLNAILLAGLVLAIAIVSTLRSHPLVDWLGGIPVSVASIAAIGALVLVAGLVPQEGAGWWMRVTKSWPFALAVLLLLFNLGLAISRRIRPFPEKGYGWLLNHLGLWLVAAGMAFGAADITSVMVTASEGEVVSEGVMAGPPGLSTTVRLPFAIKLEDFRMEARPLKFISKITVYRRNRLPLHEILEVNKPVSIGGWRLYQSGYDEAAGAESTVSGILAVRDPWLWVVYSGLFMMLAGAAQMLLAGAERKAHGRR